ncbi:hypothetical protein AB0C65_30505 [Nocardia sp. NPDC048505]|uniref:hypothetical protein n=1 Tax=Nocardia sp. NPDC048505 TaxID=3155756 RepID=UPI0033C01996
MHAFVPNDYRKRVLAEVERRGGIEFSDPFELYDIPLDEAETLSDAEVSARVAEVWGFWQKQRDHPKYRVLVGLLVDGHEHRSELLLHSGSRRAEAMRVRNEREQRDAERFEMLDTAITRLVQRYGGVPAAKVAGLEEIGAMGGLTAAEVAARLRRHRILAEEAPAAPSALTEQRRKQIRQLLSEWARLLEGPPTPTLFALLQIDPAQATHTNEIRLRAEALRARSRELPPGRVRVVLDELLVHVQDVLEAGGAIADEYVRSITEDVAAELRPKVRAAVLVEDQLVGEDYQFLLEEAIELGLDRAEAVRLLAELAGALGARIESGSAAAQYGSGGSPDRAAGSADRYGSDASPNRYGPGGSADRHGSVDSAGGRPARPPVGRSAGARSGAQNRDWEEPLKAARAALRGGRPQEAARHIAEARQLDAGANGGATPIRPVAEDIEKTLAEATIRWRDALAATTAKRFVEARTHLEHLRRHASDVPPPTGQTATLDDLLAQAEQAIATADRLVAEADSAASEHRTHTLLAAQSACADHPGAEAALAATPIEPPTAVRTSRLPNGSIVITWTPTRTGTADYKVTRRQPDGTWRAIGRTRATELEDGGAPPTGTPVYAVVAAIAGRYSAETRSDAPPTRTDTATPDTPAAAPTTEPVAPKRISYARPPRPSAAPPSTTPDAAPATPTDPTEATPADQPPPPAFSASDSREASADARNDADGDHSHRGVDADQRQGAHSAAPPAPVASAASVDSPDPVASVDPVASADPIASAETLSPTELVTPASESSAGHVAPSSGTPAEPVAPQPISTDAPTGATEQPADPAAPQSTGQMPPPVPPVDPGTRPIDFTRSSASAEQRPASTSESDASQPISFARPPRPSAHSSAQAADPSVTPDAAPATPIGSHEADSADQPTPPAFPAGGTRDEASSVDPVVSAETASPTKPVVPASEASSGPGTRGSGSSDESVTPGSGSSAPQPISPARPQENPSADEAALPDEPMPSGIPTVGNLAIEDGRLTFDWPSGVTEVMVVVRKDGPPVTPMDPAATSWKVTNSRYQIEGGVAIPASLVPSHLAVASCRRAANGTLTVASGFAATARVRHPG